MRRPPIPHLRGPWSNFSDCDRARDFVTKLGLSFKTESAAGKPITLTVGQNHGRGLGFGEMARTPQGRRLSAKADTAKVNW